MGPKQDGNPARETFNPLVPRPAPGQCVARGEFQTA